MKKVESRVRAIKTDPNEFRILRVVRDYETISRVELAHLLGLSKTTVSWLVERLLRQSYLVYVGAGNSTVRGGRRRQMLRFNPRARFVIGIDIRLRTVQMAVTDMNAAIVERTSFEHAPGDTPDQVLGKIAERLRRWRTNKRDVFAKAIGVGVGMPGVIDEEKGIVRVADALKSWKEVNLKRFFEDEFGLATFAENDVKAMTLGEYLFGASRYVPNQVCLFVGDGIGAGIVMDGRLHRGITSSAGEVGFNQLGEVLVDRTKYPLLIDGQSDFGAVVSDRRFVEVYNDKSAGGAVGDAGEIVKAAASGDRLANGIIQEAASLISVVCIQLINTLNPEMIVLAGKLAGSPLVVPLVQERVRDDVLSVPAEAVQIVPSRLADDGVLLGAAGLVLYDLFKPSRRPQLRDDRLHALLLSTGE